MKALVKTKPEQGLWMEDVPVPAYGPTEVLIKIRKTAICGTDLHIFNWDEWSKQTIEVPRVIGHEFVGVIEEIGSEVSGIKIGDRVSGEGHITCGHCRNCRAGNRHLCRNTIGVGVNRDGAFGEYLVIPASNVFVISDSISDDIASILDPFGNSVHTALSFDLVGEDVLITGAGPIGIMAAALARHVGARFVVVTDINDYRLDLASKMGATRSVNVCRKSIPEIQKELGMKEGFDVGLEMSGSSLAINQMLEYMKHGAKIALLGIPSKKEIPINYHDVIFKGLFLKGIYGREMFETWYKMSTILQSGLDITPVITNSYHVDDFIEGFNVMNSGKSCKVVLNWE